MKVAARLLLDQGLPQSAAGRLRAIGVDTIHVGEIGMSRALDEEILAHGLASGRVVVTLDADFHALLARSGAHAPSVIRLREERLDATRAARLILDVLTACSDALGMGAVVSADSGRIRLRRLPLSG